MSNPNTPPWAPGRTKLCQEALLPPDGHLTLLMPKQGKAPVPARAPTWPSPAFHSCREGLGLCLTKQDAASTEVFSHSSPSPPGSEDRAQVRAKHWSTSPGAEAPGVCVGISPVAECPQALATALVPRCRRRLPSQEASPPRRLTC